MNDKILNNLPHFALKVGELKDEENIFCTSLVKNPATGKSIQAFSSDKKKKSIQAFSNEESNSEVLKFQSMDGTIEYERIISGVWMMPDVKYYRNLEGFEFTVSFTKSELYKALVNFLKSDYSNNFDYEHNGYYLSDLVTIEHWVINDKDTRSPIMNYSLQDLGYTFDEIPVGTIMKTVYVNDEQFYNDYILSGTVKGFSIEGFFNMVETGSITQSKSKFEEQTKKIENNMEDLKSNVKKMFEGLGMNQEVGSFNIQEGVLEFSKENIKIGKNVITEGEYKVKSKFSQDLNIVIKNGKLVDFGFSEVAPVVETVVETVVEVKEVETVVEVKDGDDTKVETVVDDTKVETVVDDTKVEEAKVELTGKDLELDLLTKELDLLKNPVEEVKVEEVIDPRDAMIAALKAEKAKFLQDKKKLQDQILAKPIKNKKEIVKKESESDLYTIKIVNGVEFKMPKF